MMGAMAQRLQEVLDSTDDERFFRELKILRIYFLNAARELMEEWGVPFGRQDGFGLPPVGAKEPTRKEIAQGKRFDKFVDMLVSARMGKEIDGRLSISDADLMLPPKFRRDEMTA